MQKKIAASLASTGTSSFFMQSAEALHGDLGMVKKEDVVIAISNSGTSQEVLDIIPSIKKIGCVFIAMTGNKKSRLATTADYVLDIGIEKEACPMNLAPTSSTTVALVMGDALTIALTERRGFMPENFALYHPGGALGRRLLTNVEDIMNDKIPKVSRKSDLKEIIYEISNKRLGLVVVFDENKKAVGIITDGDIRRNILDKYTDIRNVIAEDIMVSEYKTISSKAQAQNAWEVMDREGISSLVVMEGSRVTGIVTMHDVFDFKK